MSKKRLSGIEQLQRPYFLKEQMSDDLRKIRILLEWFIIAHGFKLKDYKIIRDNRKME